ncbi:MAG: hypothetical protein AAGD86_10940, partial [Pseudomonadota bacterium]
ADAAPPAAFEQVILATDPRSTVRLLDAGPWRTDRALIAEVPVHDTDMVLHTDTATLPTTLRAPVNLHYDAARRQASATIWMNAIETTPLRETWLQSWAPMTAPAAHTIRARRRFQRALMNRASQRATAELCERLRSDRERRLWYVGSYLTDGVPLLENGVRSARLVADAIGDRYRQPTVSLARAASA